MIVFTVWQDVDDYPEMGGGEYLEEIFRNEKDAEKFCQEMNSGKWEDNITYFIRKMEVK